MPATGLDGRALLKGHALESDVLLLVDPELEVSLTAADVAAACDRRTGLGADVLVRAARTSALDGTGPLLEAAPDAEWFLDAYDRTGTPLGADGLAAAVMAEALLAGGLVADEAPLAIGTRAGARTLTHTDGLWSVDMGPAALVRPAGALADVDTEGWDTVVAVPGLEGERAALSVRLSSARPEPHTVVALADERELDAALLAGAPACDPAPQAPTALDLVVLTDDGTAAGPDSASGSTDDDGGAGSADSADSAGPARARARVLVPREGERPSSASGCCAVAVALHEWLGPHAPEHYLIEVPGGQAGVHVGPDPWAPDATVLLVVQAALTGRATLGA
ncbi:diaminopimelate epimerase [Actinomyces sp. 186855]|nr:diaminopimelate epimerase [Actinomyces sp. AC-20-1]MCL3789793.1 diaminopimelate epimerase [Actinomyces sp. 187325]MCL3793057.1 diaminopimelate epimerase [Actinomyces sp. 186855]MCL3794611.1 diaminopimelate epimerase [Actinomyces sp. 217892]